MASYVLTINSVDVTARVDKYSVEVFKAANIPTSFRFRLVSYDGYVPQVGVACRLTEDGITNVAGEIETAERKGFRGSPGAQALEIEVSVACDNSVATRRYVNSTVPAGTMKSQLEYIRALYLDDANVTLDPGQVDGPDTLAIPFNYELVANALTEIVHLAGPQFFWQIDQDLVLSASEASSVPAPFDCTDADNPTVGDVRVLETRADDANRIILAVHGGGPAVSIEYFEVPADGWPNWSYTTKYPASQSSMDMWPNFLGVYAPDDVDLEELLGYGPVGFGASPITNWDPVTHTLTYTGTGVIPPIGSIIRIPYAIAYPYFVQADDLADQAVRGIREKIIQVHDPMPFESAQAYAETMLAQLQRTLRKVIYPTDRTGLKPGQLQNVDLARYDLDGSFVVTELRSTDKGDSTLTTEVTLLESVVYQPSFQATYKDWNDSGRPGVASTGGTVGPGLPFRSVQFNRNGAFGGDAGFIYYEDENTVVCGGGDSSITAAEHESCQVFGHDCHITDG